MKTTMIATILLLALSADALAQKSPPQTSPPPVLVVKVDEKAIPIMVEKVTTSVRILGAIAETRMTLTFRNPHDRDLSGDLYFPLPEGATVSSYALDINGVMVDGVAVTKLKARQTFEKEVRKGVDPGIVAWTRGNSFKTRVFPLPARGTRTITVGYVSEVVDTQDGAVYRLPLNFSQSVREFNLRVEVVKSAVEPILSGQGLPDFAFAGWREGYRAETTIENAVLNSDLSITLPPTTEHPVVVERDDRGVVRFLVTERVVAPKQVPAIVPERLTILWDASASRATADHARELAFLESYLEDVLTRTPSIQVQVEVFRNRVDGKGAYTLDQGNLEELLTGLRDLAYDGGTRTVGLAESKHDLAADLILLFTDGIVNFGDTPVFTRWPAPVYVINSSTAADPAWMKSLARRSGGRYLNLKRMTTEAAVAGIGRPAYSFLSAAAKGAEIAETYPNVPEPVDGRFILTGILKADEAEVTLRFGTGRESDRRILTVKRSNAVEGDLLRRFWAQRKLADLLMAQKKNETGITRLGREHGLVTPYTSLIVLDTLEQYVEHGILPPKTLPDMRNDYIDIVENRRREVEEYDRNKLERIVELWRARVKWWETKFAYPEGFRFRATRSKSGSPSAGAAPGRRPSSPAAPAPSTDSAPAGENSDEDGEGLDFGDDETKRQAGREPAAEPAIVLEKWDPDTPYLEALKAAPKEQRFAVYLAKRKQYRNSPAFFLDCADFFLRKEEEQLGLQILSNIAEMELENASLLRILGHRLDQLGHLDLAVLMFEQALRLRPDEPQSYRDLGLVLAKIGTKDTLARAVDLLYRVVLGEWDRFDEIELLTLGELNQVIPRARAAGVKDIPVDPRLIKPLPLDIRIVMTWDADLTDMDLHVIEPSDEEAYYGHNRTTIGGLVSRDFTQGYGPEEYLIRKAMNGRYIIKTKFYGSSAAEMIGAVTLQVDVYTNYGKPNQKVRSMTLRLKDRKEIFVVGEIEF